MRGTSLAVAALLLLLSAAPAYGARVEVTETIDPAGDPGLTAAAFPIDEGGTLEWRRCAGGGTVCEPLPASVYRGTEAYGRVALPGDTPAGTVFEAVATRDGVETKTRTRVWQGRVASIAPPTLQGDATVGTTVTATPGTWAGGWAAVPWRPTAELAIVACREPVGPDCWVLAYGPTAVVEDRWAGLYLLASEHVRSDDPVCVPILACIAEDFHIVPSRFTLRPGSRVAISSPLGPAGPKRVIMDPAPKAPTASIRTRALRSKGRLLIGRVSCETRCTVQLKVSGGHRKATYGTLSVTGAKALTVPVRHGKLKVRIVVNGQLLASGTVDAR